MASFEAAPEVDAPSPLPDPAAMAVADAMTVADAVPEAETVPEAAALPDTDVPPVLETVEAGEVMDQAVAEFHLGQAEVAPAEAGADQVADEVDTSAAAPDGDVVVAGSDANIEPDTEPAAVIAAEPVAETISVPEIMPPADAAPAADPVSASDASATAAAPVPAVAPLPRFTAQPVIRQPEPAAMPATPAPARSRWTIPVFLLLAIVAAAVGGAGGSFVAWKKGHRIAPGVSVAGQEIGGLSERQARLMLQHRFAEPVIEVRTPEAVYKAPLAEMGGALEIERVVKDAYWFGRCDSAWQSLWRLAQAWHDGKSLELSVKWNDAALRHGLNQMARLYYVAPHNARLQVTPTSVQVIAEQSGRALDGDATRGTIERRYTLHTPRIDAVIAAVPARVTAASLAGTDIKLGEYRTRFDSDLHGRTRNIHIASAVINGTVLMPGETFSFNHLTGERTWEKGYRMAHIFERKPGKEKAEVIDGLAGGVCQVSSTLFNAVRKTNDQYQGRLRIVERNFHSLPVTYVPSGLDATVAWPNRDFRFVNKFAFPIYLRTKIDGEHLTVSAWARAPMSSAPVTPLVSGAAALHADAQTAPRTAGTPAGG